MARQRDLVLINPPFSIPLLHSSYIAPFTLASTLGREGIATRVVDLNRAALRLLLRRSFLERSRSSFRKKIKAYGARKRLTPRQLEDYETSIRRVQLLSFALRHLSELVKPRNAKRLSYRGTAYSTLLSPLIEEHLLFRSELTGFPDDMAVLNSLRIEPQVRRYARRFVPLLKEQVVALSPKVIGFSIPFSQLLFPAVLLASELKRLSPQSHICFGGPLSNLLDDAAIIALEQIDGVDSIVQHNGVPALRDLVRGSGKKRATSKHALSDPAACVLPETKHLSREMILPKDTFIPIMHSQVCYWSKCSYCDYVKLRTADRFRARSAEQIVDEIEYLTRRGYHRFELLCSAMSPKHCRSIAEEILRRQLEIRWEASFIRVDRHFTSELFKTMSASGFVRTTVGIESASDRLLKLVNKGYRRTDIISCLDALRGAVVDIQIRPNIIVDLPTSTYQEALDTLKLMTQYRDLFLSMAAFPFVLTASSEMGRNPEKFGLQMSTRGLRVKTQRGNAMPYSDPAGMSSREKQLIHAGYDQLNAQIRYDQRYDGLAKVLVAATEPRVLQGIVFEFPSLDKIMQSRIVFSRSGRRTQKPPGFLVDVIGSYNPDRDLNTKLPAHTGFRATEAFCSMMRVVAGKKLTFDALCRQLSHHFEMNESIETIAMRFIERCAVHGVFERCIHAVP